MSTTCLSKLGQIDLISIFSPYNAKSNTCAEMISCFVKKCHDIWFYYMQIENIAYVNTEFSSVYSQEFYYWFSKHIPTKSETDHLSVRERSRNMRSLDRRTDDFIFSWVKKMGVKWLQWMNVVDGLADKVNFGMDVQC